MNAQIINALMIRNRMTKGYLQVAVMLLASLLAFALPVATATAGDVAGYTAIITSPQYFGDDTNSSPVPAVHRGQDHEYTFNLPGVDRTKVGILVLETWDLDHNLNKFRINGHELLVRRHISGNEFFSNYVEVPGAWLQETGNVLYVSARNSSGGVTGELDDFMVDNVTLFYKR
jgi:hypothetical protein